MNDESILDADPEVIGKLASGHVATWQALLERLALSREEHPAAGPEVVHAWLAVADPEGWRERAERAARQIRDSEVFNTAKTALRGFDAWLSKGVLGAVPATDPAALAVRHIQLRHPEDPFASDRLDKIRQLVEDVEIHGTRQLLARCVLLQATELQGEQAIQPALRAEELFAELGDPSQVAAASGLRAHALYVLGKVDAAHTLLDRLRPGAALGLPLGHDLEPREGARKLVLEEAAALAAWATPLTPDWVRVLGALGEIFGEPALTALFRARLREIAANEEGSLDHLLTIVGHASPHAANAALTAAELLAETHPDRIEAAVAAAPLFAQHGDADRAWRTLERAAAAEPGHEQAALAYLGAAHYAIQAEAAAAAGRLLDRVAIEGDAELDLRVRVLRVEASTGRRSADSAQALFELFEVVRGDRQLLAESPAGHSLVEAVLDSLLVARDPRAIEVAEVMLATKVELWGEAPTTWLERHNLGSVCAQLGDVGRGRRLVIDALERLSELTYDDHPHVEMMRRTLEKIDALP